MKQLNVCGKFAGVLFAWLVVLCGLNPAAFAQAPPLSTVLDSNFEIVEFFSFSIISAPLEARP